MADSHAMWPRVLINESLLDKATKTEIERDHFEILKRDDNNLVYLDYLKEFFHLLVLGENKKVIGESEQDFGSPIKLFEDHKSAILTQVDNALRNENKADGKDIIRKYLELSKYHNSTVDVLCKVISDILADKDIVKELFSDLFTGYYYKNIGRAYSPKFSAEDHPEQSDMLNILGAAISRVISKHENGASTQEEELNHICEEAPYELKKLDQSLTQSRIDIESFIAYL